MNTEVITSLLFTAHLALLVVKLWSVYVVATMLPITKAPNSSKYLIVFNLLYVMLLPLSILLVISETWFMYCFFTDTDLYYYEFMAVFDEIFFTILAMTHILKGVH